METNLVTENEQKVQQENRINMDQVIIHLPRLSANHTDAINGLDVKDLFENNIEENAKYFLPLVSVDLKYINPNWNGKVHFIYNEIEDDTNIIGKFKENGLHQAVSFKLTKDNKYIYEGTYNFAYGNGFVNDGGVNVIKGGVELYPVKISTMNNVGEGMNDFAEAYEWKKIFEKIVDELNSKNNYSNRNGRFNGCYIGHKATWTQSPETPLNPDGKEMHFIGKIYATNWCDGVDWTYFLFYCPEHNIVTQISQFT